METSAGPLRSAFYKSTDSGATWLRVIDPGHNYMVEPAVDPWNPKRTWAISDIGVFVTQNAAGTAP